jgi:hypothetical protein
MIRPKQSRQFIAIAAALLCLFGGPVAARAKITELPLKTEYIWRLLRKRMAGHALNFSRKVGESSLPYRADLLIQHSYYSSPWQMG